MSVQQVPLSVIDPDPDNVRRDLGDLTELACSLRDVGCLQPIVLRRSTRAGRWTIVDGHRRNAAAHLASMTALPAIAIRVTDDADPTLLQLAVSMHRSLSPLEQAKGFRRLVDERGLAPHEIASRTGFSVATVRARLQLASLPPEAQRLVADGDLTLADATALARAARTSGTGTATLGRRRATHLNAAHPLAPAVRKACTTSHRETRTVVGGVGCGECWEQQIRTSERGHQ